MKINIHDSLSLVAMTTLFLALALSTATNASPEIPGGPQQGPIALVGATVHPISRAAIESGTVLFEKGRITAVGTDVDLPQGTQKIDVTGRHVYPALFDAYSNMGLVEINSIRATRDATEGGQINPNVKTQVAVNPDSELIPVTRSNGVLLCLAAPSGGIISGQSAVLQLDGWTWEDLTLKSPVGMHVNWPRMAPVSAWWEGKSASEQIGQGRNSLDTLQQAFKDARAYLKAKASVTPHSHDSRWESMADLLEGRVPMIVVADEIQQIQSAVAFAERENVRLIIYGGYDAPLCAELLKKHEVPIIVGGVYRLPRRRHDAYDTAYTVPARLHAAGVEYCIAGAGRFGASNVRNLPYHAATAAAYGLSADEALKAITLRPAKIFGVDGEVGSLDPNKHATLIVTDGNPLETATHVEAAYIQGRKVDLNNRHRRLWHKYQERYRREKVEEK